MNNKRFDNNLGNSDYNILRSVIYYYDDVENRVAQEVVSCIGDKQKVTLIDIGVGSGFTTLALLNNIKSEVEILGVDNEKKMIDQAKVNLEKYTNVKLIEEDAITFLKGLEDESIDGIYSGWVVHNLDPKIREDLFKEIGRVLKSKGFFVNGDKIAVSDDVEHQEHYGAFIKLLDKFEEFDRPDLKKEWIKHYEEDELIKFSESEQIKLLEDNNFENINFVFRKILDGVIVATKK